MKLNRAIENKQEICKSPHGNAIKLTDILDSNWTSRYFVYFVSFSVTFDLLLYEAPFLT